MEKAIGDLLWNFLNYFIKRTGFLLFIVFSICMYFPLLNLEKKIYFKDFLVSENLCVYLVASSLLSMLISILICYPIKTLFLFFRVCIFEYIDEKYTEKIKQYCDNFENLEKNLDIVKKKVDVAEKEISNAMKYKNNLFEYLTKFINLSFDDKCLLYLIFKNKQLFLNNEKLNDKISMFLHKHSFFIYEDFKKLTKTNIDDEFDKILLEENEHFFETLKESSEFEATCDKLKKEHIIYERSKDTIQNGIQAYNESIRLPYIKADM